jgi:hypothetical protein
LEELLLLEMLLLMLLCPSSNLSILLIEDAYDSRGYFVMNDSLVVFSDDVNAKFLGIFSIKIKILPSIHTTMSSLFSSNGSDSWPSLLNLSPLMKVPFELRTSFIKICLNLSYQTTSLHRVYCTLPLSSHTSACCRLRTLESKKPFRSPGAVLELVCLPIFVC